MYLQCTGSVHHPSLPVLAHFLVVKHERAKPTRMVLLVLAKLKRNEANSVCTHWGRGYLDFSGNMLSTLQAFAQQEHPVHIWNVIWVCAPNVPISNISFTAGMRPCHVSKIYPPGTFQMLSTHVHNIFPAYAQQVHCRYINLF
jgi:hypothetical protein